MTREDLLKAMQNHILQLKALSDKGAVIREELLKLNEADQKWFEENLQKWMKEWVPDNNLLKTDI